MQKAQVVITVKQNEMFYVSQRRTRGLLFSFILSQQTRERRMPCLGAQGWAPELHFTHPKLHFSSQLSWALSGFALPWHEEDEEGLQPPPQLLHPPTPPVLQLPGLLSLGFKASL